MLLTSLWVALRVTCVVVALSFDETVNAVAKKRLLNAHQHAVGSQVCQASQICDKKKQDLAFTLTSSIKADQQDRLAHRLFRDDWSVTEHAAANPFDCHEAETLQPTRAKFALMTLADDSFLPGLLVMLDSFITHNPWFIAVGEVLIPYTPTHIDRDLSIHLSKANRDMLIRVFPHLSFIFVAVDHEVYRTAMSKGHQKWGRLTKSIFKLEAISPAYSVYEKLLFLDSDMVVVGSLLALFNLSVAYQFAAVHDDWKECQEPEACAAQPFIKKMQFTKETRVLYDGALDVGVMVPPVFAFNSGMMVVGKKLRSPLVNLKRRALSLLCHINSEALPLDYGDQDLLNILFSLVMPSFGAVTNRYNALKRIYPSVSANCNSCFAVWASASYNNNSTNSNNSPAPNKARQQCMLNEQRSTTQTNGVKIVHYTSGKPWQLTNADQNNCGILWHEAAQRLAKRLKTEQYRDSLELQSAEKLVNFASAEQVKICSDQFGK